MDTTPDRLFTPTMHPLPKDIADFTIDELRRAMEHRRLWIQGHRIKIDLYHADLEDMTRELKSRGVDGQHTVKRLLMGLVLAMLAWTLSAWRL